MPVPKWLIALTICTLGLTGIAVAWWSRFVSPFQTRLTHVIMPLPRRHARLDGLTIAFVSDTHIGPHFKVNDLRTTIDTLRKARPDILVLGGDYVSESPRFIASSVGALEDMAATARLGTWAIYGNHDVANTRERVAAALTDAGIPVLENQSAEVATDKGSIWLAGIDDAILGHPDLTATFKGIPADDPVIALWHEPDLASDVAPFDPIFMLSGHTHGGQVRLPVVGPLAPPRLGKRYVLGRYDVDGMPLYVSSGIGMYRPPVRFNCPPEVVLITLLGEQEQALDSS